MPQQIDLSTMLAQIRKQRQQQLQSILQPQGGGSPQLPSMAGGGAGGGTGGGGGGFASGIAGLEALGSGLVSAGAIPAAAGAAGAAGGAAAGGGIASLLALLSSRRFKHQIEEVKVVGDLRWVRFKYLPELDPEQQWQEGLIAEELAETHPEWVRMDENGTPSGVYYGRIPEALWP